MATRTLNQSSPQILVNIRDILATNQSFLAWCNDYFGKYPKIQIGNDPTTPPESTDSPLITIVSWNDDRGGQKTDISYIAYIGIVIYDTGITEIAEVAGISAYRKTYDGMIKSEALREQVENCLMRKDNRLTFDMSVGGGYDVDSQHPWHESYTTITNNDPKTNRNPLA